MYVYVDIEDNNIYCTAYDDNNNNKTYWHFNNYNLILTNSLGFDIHNYVNKNIIVSKDVLNKKGYHLESSANVADVGFVIKNKKEFSKIVTYYTKNMMLVHENVEITKENVIFYFYRHYNCKKPSKIIVPLEIANNFVLVTMFLHKKDIIQLTFNLKHYDSPYKDILFNIKDIDELNIADTEFCKKRIVEGLDNYFGIFLERI